jgi:redox-sensitive bicupin YhaK (pirin superfamily)
MAPASGTGLRLLASPDGRDGSLRLNARAELSGARVAANQTLPFAPRLGRHAWLQVIRGELSVAGITLAEGDGAAIEDEREIALRAAEASELLVFDLP